MADRYVSISMSLSDPLTRVSRSLYSYRLNISIMGCADEVSVCISCRARIGNVRTTSGLSTGIAITATESGLVAPKPLSQRQISERS